MCGVLFLFLSCYLYILRSDYVPLLHNQVGKSSDTQIIFIISLLNPHHSTIYPHFVQYQMRKIGQNHKSLVKDTDSKGNDQSETAVCLFESSMTMLISFRDEIGWDRAHRSYISHEFVNKSDKVRHCALETNSAGSSCNDSKACDLEFESL